MKTEDYEKGFIDGYINGLKDGHDAFRKAIDNVFDDEEYQELSECCGSDIICGDLCSQCREHCK